MWASFCLGLCSEIFPGMACFIGSSVRLNKGGMLGDAWGLGRVVSPGLRPSVTF